MWTSILFIILFQIGLNLADNQTGNLSSFFLNFVFFTLQDEIMTVVELQR